ncbi:hypothetical protein B9Z55_028928 [Caenorhabditis nigoni]|uniref:Uncharacterized protein n=1 Tax=Caenorhabditis nigoni TaxID=1611254 RepID=A0A2G5S9R6_9PELO|nr:hypothetical protein B9Z55_028928 [Caenorhabditis nigoni]
MQELTRSLSLFGTLSMAFSLRSLIGNYWLDVFDQHDFLQQVQMRQMFFSQSFPLHFDFVFGFRNVIHDYGR